MFNNFQALFQRVEVQKKTQALRNDFETTVRKFRKFALLLYLFTLTSLLFENHRLGGYDLNLFPKMGEIETWSPGMKVIGRSSKLFRSHGKNVGKTVIHPRFLRAAITSAYRCNETESLNRLLKIRDVRT